MAVCGEEADESPSETEESDTLDSRRRRWGWVDEAAEGSAESPGMRSRAEDQEVVLE